MIHPSLSLPAIQAAQSCMAFIDAELHDLGGAERGDLLEILDSYVMSRQAWPRPHYAARQRTPLRTPEASLPAAARARPYNRPLPPYLVVALLTLSFATVVLCALLLLILAWEPVGWVRYRLTAETIACAFAGGLTLYHLVTGRARR